MPADAVRRLARGDAQHGRQPSIADDYADAGQAEHQRRARSPIGAVDPDLFQRIVTQTLPPGPGRCGRPTSGRLAADGGLDMLGKLSWAAIPFDQPIPLFAAGVVGVGDPRRPRLVTLKGWLPYLWREWITSVDHKRIGVMYFAARAGHAAARVHRRHHDALAAGPGLPVARATCRRSITTRSSRRTARS